MIPPMLLMAIVSSRWFTVAIAVAHEYVGRPGVRAVDVQAVGARTEPQVEVFGVGVVHAGGHLEAAQRVRGQRAGLVGRRSPKSSTLMTSNSVPPSITTRPSIADRSCCGRSSAGSG